MTTAASPTAPRPDNHPAIAHDLNNVFGIVVGNLDLLLEHCAADAYASDLAREALDAALKGIELTERLRGGGLD
jgi:hypothetical protein